MIETLDSHIVFRSVDLPEEGLPIMATDAHFITAIIMVLTFASKVEIKRDC